MTTSRQKAVGSAAEREVARLVDGIRVGMDGGPVDVVMPGYAALQVKKLKNLPSLNDIASMIEAMDIGVPARLRAVVVIERKGQGKRGHRTITFDLDEWAAWHGG